MPPMRPEPDGGVVEVVHYTMTAAADAIGSVADDVRPVARGFGSHTSAVQAQVDKLAAGGDWSSFAEGWSQALSHLVHALETTGYDTEAASVAIGEAASATNRCFPESPIQNKPKPRRVYEGPMA
jgi:hypothetical protein